MLEAVEAPRERVFRHVLSRGPVSAAAVAADLGVTPAAVRRHLESLLAEGLVAPAPAPVGSRGRGRPARTFVVSGQGQRAAGSGSTTATSYAAIALDALAHLERAHGGAAVAAFAEERTRALEDGWRRAVEPAGGDVAARTRALAAALDADGFAAGVRPARAHGAQLCQGHCPVGEVATRHPELCEAETRAFSRLLGVHVQRLATIAHGDHACTTFVPVPPSTAAPTAAPTVAPTAGPTAGPTAAPTPSGEYA